MLRHAAVAAIAAALVAVACAPVHPQSSAAPKPPPRNPDITPVIERFYGQVEAGHLDIAYAMLSPSYRARTSRAAFGALYGDFGDAQIHAQQDGDRIVNAHVTLPAAGGRPAQDVREQLRCTWDGDDWIIDRIDRRTAAAP